MKKKIDRQQKPEKPKKGHKERAKRKPISLKWRIYSGFAVFCAFTLVLLFLFQVVFLDTTYRSIKQREIERAADSILSEMTDSSDSQSVTAIAQQHELCVMVCPLNGGTTANDDATVSVHQLPDCMLHRLPDGFVLYYLQKAQNNGGTYSERFERTNFFGIEHTQKEEDRSQEAESAAAESESTTSSGVSESTEAESSSEVTQPDPAPPAADDSLKNERKKRSAAEMPESLLYVKTGTLADNTKVAVFLNANITPVNSTVQTLRSQLGILCLLLLLGGLVVSFFLARFVADPIEKMNQKGTELARGNYQVHFPTSGYKEVNELGETLNYATQELGKTDALRKDLIANVSHDLRTPLTMISGYAEMMRDIPGENTPENIQVIADEAKRLTTLVNTLLDVSKLQSGTLRLEKKVYSLSDSLTALVQRYESLTAAEGFTIHSEITPAVSVCADEIKISQVISNLLNNAVTYTGSEKKITVRLSVSKGNALVEITDTGCGIAKEEIDQIWDRYYRAGSSDHKRAKVGSGLGLSIVKGVMTAHNGSYGVRSTLGKGSTFWFSLPVMTNRGADGR